MSIEIKYCDPLKDVMLLKVLGEGAFSTVYSGVLRSSGKLCALKALRPGIPAGEEIDLLRRLKHPNIVSLLGAFVAPQSSQTSTQTPQPMPHPPHTHTHTRTRSRAHTEQLGARRPGFLRAHAGGPLPAGARVLRPPRRACGPRGGARRAAGA